MLCDVKMLLVFEDLNGDVVRFSTHGIYEPEEYFKEAWSHCERSFTSKDVCLSIILIRTRLINLLL